MGARRASGPSRSRSASTCSASRRRCAPTRASSARTRSSAASPGCSTTSTTSAIPTSARGHPREALKLFEEKGYPRGADRRGGRPRDLPGRAARDADGEDALRRGRAVRLHLRVRLRPPRRHPRDDAQVREEEAEAAELRGRREPRRGPRGRRGAGRGLRRARGLRHRRDGGARGRARARPARAGPSRGPSSRGANMCSCRAGSRDPPRRPRLVLRVGRAARRPVAARPAGHRRAGRGAGRELRGEGARRRQRDGRRAGAPALPRCGGGAVPASTRTPRRARPSSRSSRTRRRWSRRCRSTRPSSTSAAWSASRARPRRSAGGCGGACARRSACRSASAWRRPSSSRRWRARCAKPDGMIVVPPDGELDFLHPLPVERLWGVGPKHLREAARRGHRDGAASSPRPRRGRSSDLLGRGAGRHLHALAHSRDPRRVERRKRRRSIGAQHALGRRSRSPETVDAILVALVDRVTGRMRGAGRVCRTVVLRLRFDDFAPRHPLAHDRRGDRPHATPCSPPPGRCSTAARPTIEERGITLVGVALSNLDEQRQRHSSRCATTAPPSSTPPSTTSATASARTRSRARCYWTTRSTRGSPSCPTRSHCRRNARYRALPAAPARPWQID